MADVLYLDWTLDQNASVCEARRILADVTEQRAVPAAVHLLPFMPFMDDARTLTPADILREALAAFVAE